MPAKKTPVKDIPAQVARALLVLGYPPATPEVRFSPPRRWRFDLGWEEYKVAFEYEGATWSGKSRHTSGKGFRDDCVKYSNAAIQGWCVVRATADMVKNGTALALITLALESRGAAPQRGCSDRPALPARHGDATPAVRPVRP